MAEIIERPLFYEGQVLAAADLTASLEYARTQAARDRRYLHTPGIAVGLRLTKREQETSTGAKYKEVTLGTGVAIDHTGLQVVVTEDMRLDERVFRDSNILVDEPSNEPPKWYPVFLRGIEESVPQPALSLGPCATLQESRRGEATAIEYGRPSDAAQEIETSVDVSQGPGGSGDNPGTRILLGFVQWDRVLERFSDAAEEADGIKRRHAGAQADEVVARGGSLTLLSAPRTNPDKTAIVIDDEKGGELRFGLTNAQGRISPVLTVNSKGDVWAKGTIKSLLQAIVVESGTITDGLVLPLPQGVTEKAIADGQVMLYVELRPSYQRPHPTRGADEIMLPVACQADPVTRQVTCRVRWFDTAAAANQISPEEGGACDYTMVAMPK